MENNKNDIKVSLVLNIIIIILVVMSSIMMFTGFKFMEGNDIVLESTSIGMLKYFTVESNMLMGIVALIFSINEIKLLKGKINEISRINYILKIMSTSAVGLTFVIVFGYLGHIAKNGITSLLMNSNLFFHLIIPVLSMLTFVVFEKTNKLKFKYTFYGIIPTAVYGYYYLFNIIIHMENGKVSTTYDWYWFLQNGIWTVLIVVPVVFFISYLISIILWKLNKKSNKSI